MSTKHTPEPWTFLECCDGPVITGPGQEVHGDHVGVIGGSSRTDIDLANVQRIVACVNLLAPHPELAGVEVVSGEVMGKVREALDEGARSHRLYAMDYTEGSDPWRECIEMAERQEEALGLLGRGQG